MLAKCPGNLPAGQVQTAKTFQFSSRPIQKHNPLPLGGPNPYPSPASYGFCWVRLDPLVPIPGSAFHVVLFIVTFRYHTVNCKIFTVVHLCLFRCIGRLYNQTNGQTVSMPHPENERQQSVDDFWSCIFSNLSGDWLQTFINDLLAAFIGKSGSNMLPAPSWQWVSTEFQQFLVSHLG